MNPLAPSVEDLARAARDQSNSLAGHLAPHAVLVGRDGITILCSTNLRGDAEQTSVINLTADGSDRWSRLYPPALGSGNAMARLPNGNLVVAGDVQRSELQYQGSLMILDGSGEVVSSAAFGVPGVTGFQSVSGQADGTIVAGGASSWRAFLMHTDSALHPLPAIDLPADSATALAELSQIDGVSQASDGGLAILGTRGKSTTGFGMTRLLNLAGAGGGKAPLQLPPGRGRGEPAAVSALAGGGAYAVGHGVESEPRATQLWLARQDAGALTWLRWHGKPEEEWRGRALAVLPGGVTVAGDVLLGDDRREVRVVHYDASGAVMWERRYAAPGGGWQVAGGLATTDDGGFVLVASTTHGPGRTNVWVLRLAGDGEVRWQRVIGPRTE